MPREILEVAERLGPQHQLVVLGREGLATWRAYASSSYSASPNPMANVFTGAPPSRAIAATTALESMPPLRKAPRGTSLMRCRRTDSSTSSASRSASCAAPDPRSGSKRTSQ